MAEHLDVVIIGAGVSGIDAACRFSREFPERSFAVLERRTAIGGTWDLFRYPGVRSDSDMMTFGYNFRPWNRPQVLADGTSIREYVEDTAREFGVTDRIRFGRRVVGAAWSSADAQWTVEVRVEGSEEVETYTCAFLICCTGYYDYDSGYRPAFPGEDAFTGDIVHPQQWPAELDHAGKKVVVIGSGATAVTLVPAMAPAAEHVTMVQRSPTFVVSLPAQDRLPERLRRVLPARTAYSLVRARNIALQRGMYVFARWRPDLMRRLVLGGVRKHLGPDADLSDFDPPYDPWDQRLCIVPDGDLFAALRAGTASVVTGTIATFTEKGLRLTSGEELEADIVVTATGLQIQMLGGAALTVDGRGVNLHDLVTYKGVLVEGVPNAAVVFGYSNASWTLKADLACEYVCRLLRRMEARGHTQVVASAADTDRDTTSVLGSLRSGYVQRGDAHLPRQGRRGVWKVRNNYLLDAPMLRWAPVADANLHFSKRPRRTAAAEARPDRVG